MTMLRVGLLGSCVTREPLELLKGKVEIVWYQARTSIPSMAAVPVHLPLLFEAGTLPAFEQRNVHFDLGKSWIANIERSDYDVLLIDFIDERFGCADYGGSRFTWSTSFRAATIDENVAKTITKTMPNSPGYASLIKNSIGFVVDRLNSVRKPIICNNVYWSFLMDDGSIDKKFPETQYGALNDNLEMIYAYLSSNTQVKMLDIPREVLRSNSFHRWGSAPFHYTRENDELIGRRLLDEISGYA